MNENLTIQIRRQNFVTAIYVSEFTYCPIVVITF